MPSVATTPSPSADATWVGIGGVSGSQDLIQAGTQAVVENGQAVYKAWIETLPQVSVDVPLVVSPGDSVSVSLLEEGAGSSQWLVVFANNTTGQQYQTTTTYTSSLSSAEWIEEMPTVSEGRLTARDFSLDNFGTVAFTNAQATQNGANVSVASANAAPMSMISGQNQTLATPSTLGSDGKSFSVTRGSGNTSLAVTSPATYTIIFTSPANAAQTVTPLSPQVSLAPAPRVSRVTSRGRSGRTYRLVSLEGQYYRVVLR